MLAPCHCAKFPDSALVALDLEAPEPFRSAPAASPSSRVFKNHACMVARAAWRCQLLAIDNAMPAASPTGRRPSRPSGLRPAGDPACGGGAPERRGEISLAARTPSLREKAEPPGELQAPIAWFIPKVPPHHTTNALAHTGSASLPMVESRAVLRHVLGSIRKEKLMDTQTVIAVCELLLVVIGIVTLARKDE